MSVNVHPTAIVDPEAVLDDDVEIGPYSIVGAGAVIGGRTRLLNHVTIMGNVRLGRDNLLYPHCVIGGEPQDHSYRGEPTWVVIGDRNVLREGVTIHRATTKEHGVTCLGSDNYLMGGVHVAHDCILGSHIHVANQTIMGGHVHVHDHANLSGAIAIHHYATVGSYSFIGGLTRLNTDAPPYMLVEGNPANVRCVNLVGLKRRGMNQTDINSLSEAHRLLYRHKMGAVQARETLLANGRMTDPVSKLFAFLEQQHRGRHGRARERAKAA